MPRGKGFRGTYPPQSPGYHPQKNFKIQVHICAIWCIFGGKNKHVRWNHSNIRSSKSGTENQRLSVPWHGIYRPCRIGSVACALDTQLHKRQVYQPM